MFVPCTIEIVISALHKSADFLYGKIKSESTKGFVFVNKKTIYNIGIWNNQKLTPTTIHNDTIESNFCSEARSSNF